MKFYSTRDRSNLADLKLAVTKSLTSDGGLYLPERIDKLSPEFFKKLPELSLAEIGFEVSKLILDEIWYSSILLLHHLKRLAKSHINGVQIVELTFLTISNSAGIL